LAVAVVAWPHRLSVGSIIIVYLVMIFPSNIYAAVQRISFGGHSMGPRYLFVRSPLQLLLMVWTYLVLRESTLKTDMKKTSIGKYSPGCGKPTK